MNDFMTSTKSNSQCTLQENNPKGEPGGPEETITKDYQDDICNEEPGNSLETPFGHLFFSQLTWWSNKPSPKQRKYRSFQGPSQKLAVLMTAFFANLRYLKIRWNSRFRAADSTTCWVDEA